MLRGGLLRLLLVLCVAASNVALVVCGPAKGALVHEFLPTLTATLEKGVPAGSGAKIPGPQSLTNSMTADSGHVWVAEHVERAGKQVGLESR